MCRWCTCLRTMYTPADNVRMTCRWHPDDICHPPAEISHEVSLSCHPRIVRMSSAGHLQETSVPRLFSVKEQNSSAKNPRGILCCNFFLQNVCFFRNEIQNYVIFFSRTVTGNPPIFQVSKSNGNVCTNNHISNNVDIFSSKFHVCNGMFTLPDTEHNRVENIRFHLT